MAQEQLTDLKIKNLKPRPKQFEEWDGKIANFGVRVSPSGTKAFQLLYRYGGRPRRMTIGRYPTLKLSDARKLAQQALHNVAHGIDPALEKAELNRNPYSFNTFIKDFIEKYSKRQNRSWKETQRLLEKEFVSVWKKRDIRQIQKHDVTALLEAIIKRGAPSTASHAFADIRKVFNWAVEQDLLDTSPCMGLKSPVKNISRDRVLSDNEISSIWHASDKMEYPFGNVIQLLFLTGQRRAEVAEMRWEDLDLDNKIWSIPAAMNKSARPHDVPLTDAAVNILKAIPRVHEVLVFPARGKDNPISGFSKWKHKLDDHSNTNDWTIHDIRRTVATGLAKLKVEPYIVERILNHTSGTFGGVTGVYNRFGYMDEMGDALAKWSEYLEE